MAVIHYLKTYTPLCVTKSFYRITFVKLPIVKIAAKSISDLKDI